MTTNYSTHSNTNDPSGPVSSNEISNSLPNFSRSVSVAGTNSSNSDKLINYTYIAYSNMQRAIASVFQQPNIGNHPIDGIVAICNKLPAVAAYIAISAQISHHQELTAKHWVRMQISDCLKFYILRSDNAVGN